MTSRKTVLDNVPLKFEMVKVLAGKRAPPYSLIWTVPDWYAAVERKEQEARLKSRLRALNKQVLTLAAHKRVNGATKAGRTVSVGGARWAIYPVLEPSHNEWGEVAP